MRRPLIRSPTFLRAAKRLAKKRMADRDAISLALHLLAEDAFDLRLRTHKLKGRLADCWAASAGYDLRIIFQLVPQGDTEAIVLLTVGTHDEVY